MNTRIDGRRVPAAGICNEQCMCVLKSIDFKAKLDISFWCL